MRHLLVPRILAEFLLLWRSKTRSWKQEQGQRSCIRFSIFDYQIDVAKHASSWRQQVSRPMCSRPMFTHFPLSTVRHILFSFRPMITWAWDSLSLCLTLLNCCPNGFICLLVDSGSFWFRIQHLYNVATVQRKSQVCQQSLFIISVHYKIPLLLLIWQKLIEK